MKILMIRWKSIVEPDVISAFKARGHKITIWDQPIKNLDYDKNVLQTLFNTLANNCYDIVFSIDYFPIVARVCNVCKIRYVSWSVDCPVIQYYSKTIELPYNRIFLFDFAMYKEFYPYNPENVFYLPLGANIDHNDQIIASITDNDRQRYSAEVAFIGSTYTEKCKYNEIANKLTPWTKGMAEGFIDSQLLIYGGFILNDVCKGKFLEKFVEEIDLGHLTEDYRQNNSAFVSQFYLGEKVSEQERLRLLARLSEKFSVDMYTMSDLSKLPHIHYKGSAESRIEMPKIFHLSKINLNITSKTIQTGLPQRFWDVLGAGGFLLSNMQAELPEYLIPGKDVETYGSFDECEEKIAYYLEHEDERKQIAKNGYEKTREMYTYEHRIYQMEQILKERDK